MSRLLLCLFPADAEERAALEAVCAGRVECAYGMDEALLPRAEVILGECDPSLLENAGSLRWLQISWAGAERYFPLARASSDLTLTTASGAYGVTIAEHAIAMLLSLARRFPAYGAQQRAECWHDLGPEWTLEGKRALILGTGDLGSNLAVRLRAFGMETVGFCRSMAKPRGIFDRYITIETLDEELRQADAVFGCLPGTAETAGLLSRERLFSMKNDAILINVGRGSLIPTEALLDALDAGKFFGVGLDVAEREPIPAGHPLWHAPRVLLTPHVAGIGLGHLPETRKRIFDIFLANLRQYLDGQPLQNVVDPAQGY